MKILYPYRWFAALLLSMGSATVVAQAGASSTEAVVCADSGSSMLWQVTGGKLEGTDMTLHLFGSIHVGKRDFYPLHPVIEERFRNADKLVFEVDPQGAADPQVALRMQMRGMLPAGQTLPDVISPQTYANLQATLNGLNIPIANFQNLKPWMLTLLLANYQANALGYNAQYGLESYFIAEKSPASRILELESIDQQVEMLDSLDPELLLGHSMNEFDTNSAEMEQMIQAWRCGDKAALSTSLFDSLTGAAAEPAGAGASAAGPAASERFGPANATLVPQANQSDSQVARDVLYDTLYTQRNLHMAEGVESFIDTGAGSWFVVVGSAHLLGAGSVVDLLQQRGYDVSPITLPAVTELE